MRCSAGCAHGISQSRTSSKFAWAVGWKMCRAGGFPQATRVKVATRGSHQALRWGGRCVAVQRLAAPSDRVLLRVDRVPQGTRSGNEARFQARQSGVVALPDRDHECRRVAGFGAFGLDRRGTAGRDAQLVSRPHVRRSIRVGYEQLAGCWRLTPIVLPRPHEARQNWLEFAFSVSILPQSFTSGIGLK